MRSDLALVIVKMAHTAVWLFFVGCIMALPVAAVAGRHGVAAWLAALAVVEAAVLVANCWRFPLTGVAARDADDRRDSFDIYLPVWLAQHNKAIFGPLLGMGLAVALLARIRSA
jgi:hypothetical protein